LHSDIERVGQKLGSAAGATEKERPAAVINPIRGRVWIDDHAANRIVACFARRGQGDPGHARREILMGMDL
jgi:hypothetical protein